jgi:Flp pilus assembly protein TadD
MRFRTLSLVVFVLVLATPALADQRAEAKSQVEFGILVAGKGLWRDATVRWEEAVKLDPNYAEAWNDLGVAYEQQGKFEDARKAYEKAIKLQPDNQMIRQNYDLFREIYDRTKRRSGG